MFLFLKAYMVSDSKLEPVDFGITQKRIIVDSWNVNITVFYLRYNFQNTELKFFFLEMLIKNNLLCRSV